MKIAIWLTLPMMLFGLAAVSCSDSGDDGAASPTDSPNATTAPLDSGVIPIVLSDFAIAGESSGVPNALAGEVTFEVENIGASSHELTVIKTELDPSDLPVVDFIVDEAEVGEVLARTALLNDSESESLMVTLEAGEYLLLCNVPAHYESGMFAELVVE